MEALTVGFAGIIGFLAGAVGAYTQNLFAALAVLGIGTLVIFGTVAGGSPGPIVENFVDTVGAGGLVAAVIGGGLGLYAGSHFREGDQSTG